MICTGQLTPIATGGIAARWAVVSNRRLYRVISLGGASSSGGIGNVFLALYLLDPEGIVAGGWLVQGAADGSVFVIGLSTAGPATLVATVNDDIFGGQLPYDLYVPPNWSLSIAFETSNPAIAVPRLNLLIDLAPEK